MAPHTHDMNIYHDITSHTLLANHNKGAGKQVMITNYIAMANM